MLVVNGKIHYDRYWTTQVTTEKGVVAAMMYDGLLVGMLQEDFITALKKINEYDEVVSLFDVEEQCIWWNESKDRQAVEMDCSSDFVTINPTWFKNKFGCVVQTETMYKHTQYDVERFRKRGIEL